MEINNSTGSNKEQNLQLQIQSNNVCEFEEVKNYMYLGILITNKYEENKEIDLRIARYNNCLRELHKMLKSKGTKKIKIRTYETMIRPTLIYRCAIWILRKIGRS